jgi:hypothetical protein
MSTPATLGFSARVAGNYRGCDIYDVQQQPEFFKLSAYEVRCLRIAAEVIASDKPLTPQQRSDLSRAMLALLDKAEPIE